MPGAVDDGESLVGSASQLRRMNLGGGFLVGHCAIAIKRKLWVVGGVARPVSFVLVLIIIIALL